jgi:hypothetical protein
MTRILWMGQNKIRMPRYSAELLQLRRQQYTLARAKEYVAADRMRLAADKMEAQEMQVLSVRAHGENEHQASLLLLRHETELKALQQKLDTESLVMLESRNAEAQRLRQRISKAEVDLKKAQGKQRALIDSPATSVLPTPTYVDWHSWTGGCAFILNPRAPRRE